MQNIDFTQWNKFGDGATADCYFKKDDSQIMLKVFTGPEGKILADAEYKAASALADRGIPTPKVIDYANCGDKIGLIYERINNKISFAKACAGNEAQIPHYAKLFAEQCKKLHSLECNTAAFAGQHDIAADRISRLSLSEENKSFLTKLLNETPQRATCLHGDLSLGNVVLGWCSGFEGRECTEDDELKPYFIDIGTFSYGNPIFDLGQMYFTCQFSKNDPENQRLYHMTPDQLDDFWKAFAAAYIGNNAPEAVAAFEKQVCPYAAFFALLIWDTAAFMPMEVKNKVCQDIINAIRKMSI